MYPERETLEKYAKLIVKIGLNLQKDQTIVISSPIECAAFAREVAKVAYLEGARDVIMNWKDELFSKIRFLHAQEIVFEEFPAWQKEFYMSYAKSGAAFLSIAASDPEIFKDVNPNRLSKAQKTGSLALKEYQKRIMSNQNAWCVASIPTQAWANKVFPGMDEKVAMQKLWDVIFKIVRVDAQDPLAAWQQHKNNLKKQQEFLNSNAFYQLRFRNSLGTDLTIELPEGHIWLAGSEFTPEGVEFIANMPTEEVFIVPKKGGVNGTVVSSKPLNYNGVLIEKLALTFKDGKITSFTAPTGYEMLKNLIETDEGSCYLGEVALVPDDSPISNANILFYNTLFDENASCHLAIGKAYDVCLKDSQNMTEQQLVNAGVNDSLVHVDFMIGTSDLSITGVKKDGEEVIIFKDGNYV